MTNASLHRALFEPRRIALIGASSDPARLTARAQIYLRKHGFAGDILPVHPREAEVLGERAYPSVADIPGPVDLAYILLNTPQVEGVVQAVAAKGTRRWAAPGFPPGAALAGLLLWEGVKLALTVGMLMAAPRFLGALSWPALLIGLVLTIKMYWVGLLWARPKKSAHGQAHEE